jgi:tRNA (mo5U34)-methyltransferase
MARSQVPERDPTASPAASVPLWYHTLELPGRATTPGWFDLRGIVERLPWPDVRGKRCLDVGTYDGFYAFELERRGAQEVIAIDIDDGGRWDLPAMDRQDSEALIASYMGKRGIGFDVARQALESKVEKRILSVYDLDPVQMGTFDVVVCGSLLLHLRDPIGALEAIHSVCRGWFLSVEEISLGLTTRFRRRAVADMRLTAKPTQWWVPNVAGHRHMLESAGFQITATTGPFAIPYGVGHPPRGGDIRSRALRAFRKALAGDDGVPHAAALSRPRSAHFSQDRDAS